MSVVDVVDDQQMSGQQLFKHEDRPSFQGLRQNCVVGIRAGPTCDVPGLVIDTHTHQCDVKVQM